MNYFKLNNLLNWITTNIQYSVIFWIEFSWHNFELNIEMESYLGKIQTLNWMSLGIGHGYPDQQTQTTYVQYKFIAWSHLFEKIAIEE